MSALTDKLARLRADLAAATPGPLKVDDDLPTVVLDARGYELAVFDGVGATKTQDAATARAHVSAVNAAPTLIDVVEAAAKRPWWVVTEQMVSGRDVVECVECRARTIDSGSPRAKSHKIGCDLLPLDAALDRAEAEAK